ncbi:carbon-nitrogen hydrolase family protein [Mucilaginibacter hurinus]|uniref:Carbon-nitrogen hydrolase family protein n=1 Tax=Mucilaginibacter hurinus TaxID=2201324 RepID=A0A367GNB4_9SPHI|nr:carbon-nitrogen hydrolase family protein [Mucilaginibacter hurinus]RCH54974.1 carbon-nitrogen hydrolase family protein [Mucilaginibacter hurinus]
MKIALATPPFVKTLAEALEWVKKQTREAANKGADIVCFPESYLPGYPLMGFEVESPSPEKMQNALATVQTIAAENNIAIIIPMDWYDDGKYLNVAQVVSAKGELLGYQAKNQLDPSEDELWDAGQGRQIFEVNGVKFGIVICHEGFRYGETVRWAARQGAQIVFHPHCNGSDTTGVELVEWGHKDNPYYEKATMMRAIENTIYVAGINYASRYPESASAIIAPNGVCLGWQPYGEPGVLVTEIDTSLATALLAKRFKPNIYAEN